MFVYFQIHETADFSENWINNLCRPVIARSNISIKRICIRPAQNKSGAGELMGVCVNGRLTHERLISLFRRSPNAPAAGQQTRRVRELECEVVKRVKYYRRRNRPRICPHFHKTEDLFQDPKVVGNIGDNINAQNKCLKETIPEVLLYWKITRQISNTGVVLVTNFISFPLSNSLNPAAADFYLLCRASEANGLPRRSKQDFNLDFLPIWPATAPVGGNLSIGQSGGGRVSRVGRFVLRYWAVYLVEVE